MRPGWTRAGLAALSLALVACGGDDAGADSSAAGDSAPPTSALAVDAGALLADSWMNAAARDPATVTALLDAPGGDGWLDLFHGDLASAKPRFEAADSASARLGLARTHLARAAALQAGARLHAEAALDLARYRRDHAAAVRVGVYEPVLAGLTAQRCGAEGDERDAFLAAAAAPHEDVDGSSELVAALRGVLEGSISTRLSSYADRLAFIEMVGAGAIRDPAVVELLPKANLGLPDWKDSLGADADAGIAFEALYFDCGVLPALARWHLGEAWIVGSGLTGPGPAIAAAVEGAWGAPLPDALRDAALPPPEPAQPPLPEWTAFFASPAIDRADWDAYWGGAGASSFAARFGHDDASADAVLSALADAETSFAEALREGAPPEGASLVDELDLAAPAVDRVLRARMLALTGAGETPEERVACKRYGDRAVDANPGSRGGSADSRRTRVSYRNDRAFLIDYARCLWRAGQPGGALDFVHPLATEDPALQSVKHYLGQLDAAASIGVQGKTSQL